MKTLDWRFNSLALLYYFLVISLAICFFLLQTGTMAVLCFHNILDSKNSNSPIHISLSEFHNILAGLQDKDYQFISTKEFLDYFYNPKLTDKPGNKIFLTFDDGYENHLKLASPLLDSFRAPATFGIIGDQLGKNDYLTKEQLPPLMGGTNRSLSWHSRSHLPLEKASLETQKYELTKPEELGEGLEWDPIFIYPFGEYFPNPQKLLKPRFKAGLTLENQFVTPLHSPFLTPRFLVMKENKSEILPFLEFYKPEVEWEKLMKWLVLFLTFLCGRFAFLARDIEEKKLITNF